jgi:hypothetical protein
MCVILKIEKVDHFFGLFLKEEHFLCYFFCDVPFRSTIVNTGTAWTHYVSSAKCQWYLLDRLKETSDNILCLLAFN